MVKNLEKKALNGCFGNKNAQEYEITVFDNKTIEQKGELGSAYSELTKKCKGLIEYFQTKHKGRLGIRIIIR